MNENIQSRRWKKLLERVSLEKNLLDDHSKNLLEKFYHRQDEIFRTELQNSMLGAWVGFSTAGATDQSSAFDANVKMNGGEVFSLGKFDPKKVKLVRFVGQGDLKSVQIWVDPRHSGYNKAYKLFAKQEFDFEIASSYGVFLNVDHIFNHARAQREALSFVRLALVDADINQMWGGEYESVATTSSSGSITGVRFATDFLLAKIFRLHPPQINEKFEIEESDMNIFVDQLHHVGVIGPKEVLRDNIRLAINKARTGLRYRRVCVADREKQIFYFNLDLPMENHDKGPDFIEFELRASGRDLSQLASEKILEAKNAVIAWVFRKF